MYYQPDDIEYAGVLGKQHHPMSPLMKLLQ